VYAPSPFPRLATWTARLAGHPSTLRLAGLISLGWTLIGPLFHCSATGHLGINTGTTSIPLLRVLLMQNTQHRDSAAIPLKRDELIWAMQGAHNALLNLEELTEADRERLCAEALAQQAREELRRGQRDTGTLDMRTP
jgi:low affinity Fe/Cu permease